MLSDATESATPTILPLNTSGIEGDAFYIYYEVAATITPDEDNDSFIFKVFNDSDNGKIVYEADGIGETTFNFELWSEQSNSGGLYDLRILTDEFSSTTVDYSIVVRKRQIVQYGADSFEERTFTESGTGLGDYRVASNMPDMKIIDFLTGIFKMFNLTAYTDADGKIVIETLDDYYRGGNIVNLTKFIDSSKKDVSKNKLYSEINFMFEDTSTFAALNSNEITGDVFGNEVIEDVNTDTYLRNLLAFDGGTYDVKPKFEKVMFERMTDQSTPTTFTDISWGWLVDKDQKPVLPKAILLYVERMDLTSSTPSQIALDYYTGYINTSYYYRPSNTRTDGTTIGQSLHFGSENDEYYFSLGNNEESLFNNYWYNYIKGIYDKQSRIVTVNAYLPTTIISSIKLNDEIVIKERSYFINKIDVNITTGKASLELITKWDIDVGESVYDEGVFEADVYE
jgi:hypothetical protein